MGFVMTMEELAAARARPGLFNDVEYLFTAWLTSPETVRRLLPEPLEPVAEPLAWGMLANYIKTNFSPPYREAALFLSAQHQGYEGLYCLSMPITDGQGMVGGREFMGFPKKLAEVECGRQRGGMSGWSERQGHRFFEMSVELNGVPNDPGFAGLSPWQESKEDPAVRELTFFNFKAFRSATLAGFDFDPQLIRVGLAGRLQETILGRAEVKLSESPLDPWAEVEIERVLGAVYVRGEVWMPPGVVAAEADPLKYAPYYKNKFDM